MLLVTLHMNTIPSWKSLLKHLPCERRCPTTQAQPQKGIRIMKSYHMTTADVSVSVDLPRSSVYNAARVKGLLPNVKLGGRLYFAPEDFRNWNHKRLNAKPFNVDTAEPI